MDPKTHTTSLRDAVDALTHWQVPEGYAAHTEAWSPQGRGVAMVRADDLMRNLAPWLEPVPIIVDPDNGQRITMASDVRTFLGDFQPAVGNHIFVEGGGIPDLVGVVRQDGSIAWSRK